MCIALISKSLFSSLWGWGTCSSKSSCPSKRTWNEALLWLVDTGANEEREPISFEKRDLYQVIDSPTDLLVWGLDRGSHAGTQPLFFCQGKKKSGGHLCMYLLPLLLLLQKKTKPPKERSDQRMQLQTNVCQAATVTIAVLGLCLLVQLS